MYNFKRIKKIKTIRLQDLWKQWQNLDSLLCRVRFPKMWKQAPLPKAVFDPWKWLFCWFLGLIINRHSWTPRNYFHFYDTLTHLEMTTFHNRLFDLKNPVHFFPSVCSRCWQLYCSWWKLEGMHSNTSRFLPSLLSNFFMFSHLPGIKTDIPRWSSGPELHFGVHLARSVKFFLIF